MHLCRPAITVHTEYAEPVTVSRSNPYSAVPTGTCLVCGDPISYQIRGRPRLYCEKVRCRRRGARKRAQAAAWEEGQAAEVAEVATDDIEKVDRTYEVGVRDGTAIGRADAAPLVRLLADKGDAFIQHRQGQDLLGLEQAIRLARRWLEANGR